MSAPVSEQRSERLRWRGALVPSAAVVAILLLLWLLAGVVDLDRAVVPKPSFRDLALQGYPDKTPLKEAGMIVDATLWWLCLSFVLWVVGLAALVLCWRELRGATRHDAALQRLSMRWFFALLAGAVLVLLYLVFVSKTSLMSLPLLVKVLDMMSHGFVDLATLNTALKFVVAPALLLTASLLLLPGVHADAAMPQVRAVTRVMYAGAAFLLVWISAATAMYRLAATLLAPEAREAALKLAPTVSLMAGLLLSLLLGVAYLSACAWLQHRHDQGAGGAPAAAAAESPKSFLAAHWPKVTAILMPLLPGAAGAVLQAMTQAP